MKNFPLIMIAMLFSVITFAQQEKCDTDDESIADPNSITKCAIEDTKDGKKQLSIEVSTRRRVVRKKNDEVSAIGGSNSSQKVANIKQNSLLIGKLELEDNSATIGKMPFNLVEEIPLFKKCNNVPLVKQTKCFDSQMNKHIVSNFKFPQEAFENGIGGRVLVQFTINELGDVESIQMRGPKNGKLLENEARRIVNNLPKFIPGKHNGKNVKVKYGVPIFFRNPNAIKTSTKIVKKKVVRKTVIKETVITDFKKFQDVENIPLFKPCLKSDQSDKEKCFNQRMSSHIQRNFNYPDAAAEKNIHGRVWVRFIIDKEGNVGNFKVKGPKDGKLLEEEAKRMVSKLPKFIPGKHEGKITNVEYYLPINFTLQE